jgi:hypothetical protein
MFVCLKALFSAETLDEIILREYASLPESEQTLYRTTAALEAAGALPHRQMVLRVTGLPASIIAGALEILEGLVEEEEKTYSLGIYLWRTRHEVVAELISRYKFDAEAELKAAIEEVGVDPPLQRYRVRIYVLRSRLPGLLEEDRRTILKAGLAEAESAISRFADNKYMYFAAADVAEEWFRLTGEIHLVEWAKTVLQGAYEKLLDPDISDRLRDLWQL